MLSLCFSSFILISSFKGHFSHFSRNSRYVFLHPKKERISTSPVSISHDFHIPYPFSSLYLGQIAVSHTTACVLWQGGVPVLRGSGVLLQLGKIGILSCLHKLLSGRR